MSFSALQRAENSSIERNKRTRGRIMMFQCSSASRKFLNRCCAQPHRHNYEVSVLFSEPKIPQLCRTTTATRKSHRVSVLFSEPKIPQSRREPLQTTESAGFSALQRAENSSMLLVVRIERGRRGVSVLFSEPKIPQSIAPKIAFQK